MTIGPGGTFSHYRLIEKIGEGGMGVVYRAHDTRLERDVALKVLPAGALADDAARKRFRKEALALSKLNHPNIATVFDFDTQDGTDFLVMEYIPGITLDRKLAEKPLTEKEIVQVGAQLVEGLTAAHDQGVLHRDLKPGNLRVTPDGRLKILDFGLAKLLRPVEKRSQEETATETRGFVGTLPYMAPEQLRGETLDARTDIWAMGVVLYEMASGKRPFRGDTAPTLSDAILNQPLVTPRALNSQVSPDVERIILKCLERDPEQRYHSALDLMVDFRRLGARSSQLVDARSPFQRIRWSLTAATAVLILLVVVFAFDVGGVRRWLPGEERPDRIESLAVLPLDNLMGEAKQQFFVDGMHEALISNLASIRALRVISRTSVMRYRDTDKSLPEIGRELNVDAVVEGSVFRSGNQVRITAQLVHASSDTHLWAGSYEGDLRDVLGLQSKTAQAIARGIRITITPEEQGRLANVQSLDPQAYEAYLRGRHHLNQRITGLSTAIEYFERSLDKEPGFALAHAGLAECYTLLAAWGIRDGREVYPKAEAAASRALEIDNTLADAHLSLAFVLAVFELDWTAAEAEYRNALALNPNNPWAHHYYAYFLLTVGRYDDALHHINLARQLDPFSINIEAHVGEAFYYAHRFDESIDWLESLVFRDPDYALTHLFLGTAYAANEMYREAINEYLVALRLSDRSNYVRAILAHAYAMSGETSEAKSILRELEAERSSKYVSPFRIALVYSALGEDDQAFKWLETAFEERNEITYINADPLLDPLRSDPRFQDLVRRVGLPTD